MGNPTYHVELYANFTKTASTPSVLTEQLKRLIVKAGFEDKNFEINVYRDTEANRKFMASMIPLQTPEAKPQEKVGVVKVASPKQKGVKTNASKRRKMVSRGKIQVRKEGK